MQKTEVMEKVKAILVENLGCRETEIVDEASLIDDLGADSLDSVEIVMEIENQFDIEIPDEEAEKMTTVGAIVDAVVEKLAE